MSTNFDLNKIPGLLDAYQSGIDDIGDDFNERGGSDARSLTITISFKPDLGGAIKTSTKVKVSLPNPETVELDPTWTRMQDGTLELESTAKQTSILDQS